MKKLSKYRYVFVVQGNYGTGWDDLSEHDSRRDAVGERKVYTENEPRVAHRVVARRVLRESPLNDTEKK